MRPTETFTQQRFSQGGFVTGVAAALTLLAMARPSGAAEETATATTSAPVATTPAMAPTPPIAPPVPAARPAAIPVVAADHDSPATAPVDSRRKDDASVDRNLLLPTAETLPKGTVAFNSYELVFAGVSYGLTDRLQLSATTMLPITSDVPFILSTSLKYNIHRAPRLLFTVMGNGVVAHADGTTLGGIGATALVDGLLDEAGKVVLTGGFTSNFLFGSANGDVELAEGTLMMLWTGLSARVGEHVKLKAEVILPATYSWASADSGLEIWDEGLVGAYGVRFFGKTLAVDLSFIRPLSPEVDTGGLVMGLPFVAFTAAF